METQRWFRLKTNEKDYVIQAQDKDNAVDKLINIILRREIEVYAVEPYNYHFEKHPCTMYWGD